MSTSAVFPYKVLWGGHEATHTINASELFWLPANTPLGNLSLKLLSIRERVAHINTRIDEAWSEWTRLKTDLVDSGYRQSLVVEEVVYAIRRATDELLSIHWLLVEQSRTGTFPTSLEVDCIGAALKKPDTLVEEHREFLAFCNGASNAYKHSFLQSDLSIAGVDEPCVFALRLPGNSLLRKSEFYSAPLNSLVAFFSTFVENVLEGLRLHGARLQAMNG